MNRLLPKTLQISPLDSRQQPRVFGTPGGSLVRDSQLVSKPVARRRGASALDVAQAAVQRAFGRVI